MGERIDMKEVFQEYGGVIVTIVAIVALISVISLIVGTGESGQGGIVYGAFQDLIENFVIKAGISAGTQ